MMHGLGRRLLPLLLLSSPVAAQSISFPTGVVVPIRVLHAVTGGRDTVGSPVVAQTLAAMVQDSCVIVPPFAVIRGHVVRSIGGRRLGRSGQLGITFDSLEFGPGVQVPIEAVLDTLEYTRSGQIRDSGVVHARTSRLPIAIGAAATVVDVVPAALFGGYLLVRRGARVDSRGRSRRGATGRARHDTRSGDLQPRRRALRSARRPGAPSLRTVRQRQERTEER